ncbi:hypothetical protein [Scytonema sp. PRP1]|uniref:hypothetical protein n=1 Tax=Scytonema sp. PRP1 TaxID=3120513 RepID=UPI00300C22E7
MRRIRFIVLFLLGIVFSLILLTGSRAQETQETLRTPSNPADLRGWEIYPAGQVPPDQSIPLTTPSDLTSLAIAAPQTEVSTFAITLVQRFTVDNDNKRQPISLLLYDAGTTPNDGDAVRITFNNRVVNEFVPLTISGTSVPLRESDFKPGINRLVVTALGVGTVPLNTVGIIIPGRIIGDGNPRDIKYAISSGQTITATLGFPQIALCKTRFRFPCRQSGGMSVFPETAQHVLEAQGMPPEPITAPLVPGATGNPYREDGYPRLLTLDRQRRIARGQRSTRSYVCPPQNGIRQDRDEYPPAAFLENGVEDTSIPIDPDNEDESIRARFRGSAHIKCISSRDNQQSGNSFGQQLASYKEFEAADPYPIENGSTIEFVILD